MNPCIFVSVCNMFLFSFRVKLNIAMDTSCFFAASSIVKKVFVTTRVKDKKITGVQSYNIAIQQNSSCCRETVQD